MYPKALTNGAYVITTWLQYTEQTLLASSWAAKIQQRLHFQISLTHILSMICGVPLGMQGPGIHVHFRSLFPSIFYVYIYAQTGYPKHYCYPNSRWLGLTRWRWTSKTVHLCLGTCAYYDKSLYVIPLFLSRPTNDAEHNLSRPICDGTRL